MTSSARYLCAACGKVASTVTLVAPGQPDPRLGTVLPRDSQLSIDGGPVSITIAPVPMEQVASALENENAGALFALDHEYAPFWCPRCAASYCRDHYQAKQVYVQGFPMSIRGVCPQGHKRTIKD
jgi:predicted RNA-binding Zn-ribbon protein involved in translation (DUF1610 family)